MYNLRLENFYFLLNSCLREENLISACDYCHYSPNFNTTKQKAHMRVKYIIPQIKLGSSDFRQNFSERTINWAFSTHKNRNTDIGQKARQEHFLSFIIFSGAAQEDYFVPRSGLLSPCYKHNKDRRQEMIRRKVYQGSILSSRLRLRMCGHIITMSHHRKKKHFTWTHAHAWVGGWCLQEIRPISAAQPAQTAALSRSLRFRLILIAICAQFLWGAHPPSNAPRERYVRAPRRQNPALQSCVVWSFICRVLIKW
jgi:hypothetical protein